MEGEIREEYNIDDRNRLFSEIVHESRNAITACEGFIELMLENNTFNARYLKIVLSELKRAVSILNSYADTELPCPHSSQCDLNCCIDEVCTLLIPKFQISSIDLKLSLGNIPKIWGDPSKIKQVLLNIIENAINAIGQKGEITIETQIKDDAVNLSICDTGSGIDDSIKDQIFKAFFTTRSKGTGLGLYMCKKIIESCSGTIALDKTEEGLTKFVILFPMQGQSG